MIPKKIEAALNKQLNEEWFSAYLYKSMTAYFEAENLPGFANWMNIQTHEELSHGEKFFNFIHERLGTVKLTTIEGPKTSWENPLNAFQDALKHERKITASINKILDLAHAEKDYPTITFLQWFVDEQVEEEATADKYVEQLKRIGDNQAALLQLDRDLGQRTLPQPTKNA